MFEPEPLDHIAAVDIDHDQAATGARVPVGEAPVEGQTGKASAEPRLREADDGRPADEGEAARIAGAETDRREAAAGRIDGAELAGSRIQEPEPAVGKPRRMRHG